MKRNKRRIRWSRNKNLLQLIIIAIILFTGVVTVIYPVVSNMLYEINKSELITDYDTVVEDMSVDELEEEFRKAQDYNEGLLTADVVLTDPFDPTALEQAGKEPYASLLNAGGNGIMGYVEIPLIDVYLPIYHGTAAKTLEQGIGHLENTSLPVGGTGTHSVLTGHTGLAGEKMFTDLAEVQENDIFYIHVLGRTLAYEVDQVEIVEPEDTGLLLIDREEDYVTLLTCYPYGVNSHRLLVRGVRTDYIQAKVTEEAAGREVKSRWESEYEKALIMCAAIYIPVTLLLLWFLRKKKRGKRQGKRKRVLSHRRKGVVDREH